MADAQTAMTQLKEAYGASIVEMTPINGTPRLRVKKDDLPQVAHYLHTHPNLRGSLVTPLGCGPSAAGDSL